MERLERPIFIGGCGSSGTTLLRKMLNMHPNIVCGPELSVFDRPMLYKMDMNLFYTLWRNQDFEALEEGCVFPIRVNPGNKSYFAFNREKYYPLEKWEEFFDAAESPADFFNLALSQYALDQDKKRWCEKTPNNIFCIKEILKTFPDSIFIEVLRDGRDVVLSLVQRRKVHPMIAIYRWISSINASDDGLTFPDHISLTYEDLVTRPARTLNEICKFLDEKYHPKMLQYWKHEEPPEIGDSSNETLNYGKKPVFKDSMGKWKKKDVNPTLLRMMDLTLTDTLDRLGYEV